MYNFDKKTVQDKNSIKWKMTNEENKEIIPMWIADMDFEVADEIKSALSKKALQGGFGYAFISDDYKNAIVNWNKKRFNCEIKSDWIVQTPGVVSAINSIILAFTNENDKITFQTPVYHPFFSSTKDNNRIVNASPLILKKDKYEIDFIDLENKLKESTMMMICNPHNPTGKVFTKNELIKIGDLCLKYNIFIVSDEIHEDLVFKNYKHETFLNLGEKYFEKLIVITAGSKTFNIAGLDTSNCIIPNEEVRLKYTTQRQREGSTSVNTFGALALETAYNYGENWLLKVLQYLEENKNFTLDFIKNNIPKLHVIEPEGTYFIWIDCKNLNLENTNLSEFFIKKASVYMNNGEIFGGNGFVRMNIACRRELLEKALNNIKIAVENI